MPTPTASLLDQKIRKRLTAKKIDGPASLVAALAQVGHTTDRSQALRWLSREITPRPAAMRALAQVLGLPAADLAAWFLEAA